MYVFISTLSQKFVDYLFFYDIGVFIEGTDFEGMGTRNFSSVPVNTSVFS